MAPAGAWRGDEDDARRELRLRAIAPPVALALAWLVFGGGLGRGFFRTFLSMWLHELGHAVTAWLAGFSAIPGPWKTQIAETRSLVVTLLLGAALATLAYKARRARRFRVAAGAGVVLLVQLLFTFGLGSGRAQVLITFGGDAGGMVLGTILFATFYSPPGSYLHEHWLRWGFLVIGTFGFMDPFCAWWRAHKDPDSLPYGETEGVGASDPSKLVDDFGWNENTMVTRYVTLGVLCLLGMIVIYVLGLRDAQRRLRESAAPPS